MALPALIAGLSVPPSRERQRPLRPTAKSPPPLCVFCAFCGHFPDRPKAVVILAPHTSNYDGLVTVKGSGVTARVLGWPKGDVMAVEIEDQRTSPEPISVDLRMLPLSSRCSASTA